MTGPVVALGVFDGVHVGHRSMLDAATELSSLTGGVVWAVTFWPHPQLVVSGHGPEMLMSLDDRIAALQDAGAQHVEVVEFSRGLSMLSPREFVEQWLRDTLHASGVVVGDNFRFGYDATGTVDDLRSLATDAGLQVRIVDLVTLGDEPVSSSRIRSLLADGEIEAAQRLLGRPYCIGGSVVRGAGRGRQLGFPTANVENAVPLLLPGDGVYAGYGRSASGTWPAAISIGTNPQFTIESDEPPRVLEAHLLHYPGDDLYGHHLDVDLHHRIRGQQRFDSVDHLVAQIREDITQILGVLGE